MRRLGISLYPEHSTEEKDFAYMELAAKYGFKRIFTCLLSVDEPKEEIMKKFKRFMDKAHSLGFEVAVDTNPKVFEHLGASAFNIKPFHDMDVDVIRLDFSFGPMMDALVAQNPYGIKVEFNGSFDTGIELLINSGVEKDALMICHNFFPQRYTGLGWQTFMDFNKKWSTLGVTTAAFVSSNEKDTFGPWPVKAGLPTCEIHRELPIDVQTRHLIATKQIDDIIIGNAFASENELKEMGSINLTKVSFKIEEASGLTQVEKEILYNYDHSGRNDAPDYMLRSIMTRIIYKDSSIPFRKHEPMYFSRGDIVIINDNLGHYRGELQVVLRDDLPNDGERNYIGRIPDNEMIILDLVKPGHKFKFIK
ncbi:MAG: DUF871 domain-containing protein [Coprobacillaceae bacterium]